MRMRKRTRDELRLRGDEFCRLVNDVFECDAIYSNKSTTVIRGRPRVPVDILQNIANSRLNPEGYRAQCEGTEGRYILSITSGELRKRFPWIHVILFAATVLSVLFTAALNASNWELLSDWSLIWSGVPFTFWLMAILVFHEFGHYTFSRLRGVDVSLPYFIPAPLFFVLGTLGAVIKSRSPMKNRRHLLDVAAAGPIAGFIVALPAIIIGLAKSEIVETVGTSGLNLGNSLIFGVISNMMVGPIPEGHSLLLHPIAAAGWFGLLVTMFNLLPISSLDGGHIAYALFGRRQRYIGYATIALLVVLSFWWKGWLIWVGIILFIGPEHPPTLFDEVKVGKWRRFTGYICFVIFVLCFIPVPISVIG
jgi:Zn-dependent protease